MWDQAQIDSSGLLVRPLLSLWRQSVELTIKAAVIELAGGLDLKSGHDLTNLFDQLLKARVALGCNDDDDLTQDVAAMIAWVQSFDPTADRFRYPASRKGEPYSGVDADLDELLQAHWIITTWCEGAVVEVEEGRSGTSPSF